MGKVKDLYQQKVDEVYYALLEKKISMSQAKAQLIDLGFDKEDAEEAILELTGGDGFE